MSFDFMKNLMFWEDEERFVRLCEGIEEVIREVQSDSGDSKISELEIMQAIDHVGFNLFRDNWEEFKRMEFNRDLGSYTATSRNSHIH